MSVVKQIVDSLDAISQQIWDDSLDDSTFDNLRQKALGLSAQIAVHNVLQNTVRHLLGPQNPPGLSNTQSRLGKFIDVLYGKLDNERNEARWQKLRDMDCAIFLFIAVSYTPLDIIKMHRIEFDYLVDSAAKFLHVKGLPAKWVFRKEIQIAIAGKAELEEAVVFRRKYYALEFNTDLSGKGQSGKGNPLEHQSPNGPKPDDQLKVLGAQGQALENYHSSASATVSPIILPLTEAGIILASIKEGHGEDGVRSIQPRKRRHIEHIQATEAERFPAVGTEKSAGKLATGSVQTGRPESEQLSKVQTGRKIDYRCSEAPISLMPLLGDPLFNAVAASNQWKWERKVGGPRTDCMNAMVPQDRSQDISITLSLGYEKGLEVIDKFKLTPT